jgi:hypothetical protein
MNIEINSLKLIENAGNEFSKIPETGCKSTPLYKITD